MLLHCHMYPLSMHNFNLVPNHWPTEPPWDFYEVKKCTEFLVRSWLYFQKIITVNVVTCQDGAIQFSDKIQDFPTDLKQTQSSEIMCHFPPVSTEFLTIQGTTALMASSFRHTGQIQSIHHQNLATWPKTAFDIAQILFAIFYFTFWGWKFWN